MTTTTPPSLRSIFEANFALVWRWASERGLDVVAIEDLIHDVFVEVHARLDRYEPGEPWLRAIFDQLSQPPPVAPASVPGEVAGPADDAMERLLDDIANTLAGGDPPNASLRGPAWLVGGGMFLAIFTALIIIIVAVTTGVERTTPPSRDAGPAAQGDQAR